MAGMSVSTPVPPPPPPPGTPPPSAPGTRVQLRHVNLVSSQPIQVQGDIEVAWFEETRDKYLSETKFTENTDLRDLDRLLVLELMIFRWTNHIAAGVDYDGQATNDEQLRKNIKEYSDQINKIKATMSLTKSARDDAANDGNFAIWLANVKARAKAFGIHRERQLTKALTLFNELSTIVGTFDRADEEEKRKTGFESTEEIVDWIRDTMIPEYQEIDTYFRTHEQRYWVRDL